MLPDWVSNPGPLTYESGALPIVTRGPAHITRPVLSPLSILKNKTKKKQQFHLHLGVWIHLYIFLLFLHIRTSFVTSCLLP